MVGNRCGRSCALGMEQREPANSTAAQIDEAGGGIVELGDRRLLVTINLWILMISNWRPLAKRFPALVQLPKKNSTLQVDRFGPRFLPVASVGPAGTQ
jgi:hypothetical protein